MKKKLMSISVVILTSLLIISCEDRSDLTAPTSPSPNWGAVDFTNFVSIGNSFTAGYQSSALYENAQMYSFPNLIAKQVGANFVQPLISDPGIGGRIEILSLNPFTLTYRSSSGTLRNPGAAYNNLGIPGIVLADVVNSVSSASSFSKSPFIDIVLQGRGSQFSLTKSSAPSFITLWIGNNDVLGFATSGGVKPSAPTDPTTFAGLYSQLADSISAISTNLKVAVGNILDVSAIPFFTTVGPSIAASLSKLGITGMYYQQHGQFTGTTLPLSALTSYSVLITLLGNNYTAYLGKPSGKFYKDNNVDITPLIAGGILDTNQVFGLHPKNPWPDALILDAGEINTAKTATAAFNTTIANIAAAKGFGLVNFNSIFNQIRASDATGGTIYNGIPFTTTFVTGGLFSLDGVHPTSRGQGIIANEFIKEINSKWSVKIPLVNISTIPGSLILGKMSYLGLPIFDKGTFDNLLF
jgi:lysophospholipase L1-like esterase